MSRVPVWIRVTLPGVAALAIGCSGSRDVMRDCADVCGGTDDCYASCMCESGTNATCATSCAVPPDDPRLGSPTVDASTTAELARLLELVNEQRGLGGCCSAECIAPSAPLKSDSELEIAAQLHADDMAKRGYFDHVTPEGLTPFDRIRAAGFRGCAMAENLGLAYDAPDDLVVAWLASTEHCTTMLDVNLDRAGGGRALDATGIAMWVMDFGRAVPP